LPFGSPLIGAAVDDELSRPQDGDETVLHEDGLVGLALLTFAALVVRLSAHSFLTPQRLVGELHCLRLRGAAPAVRAASTT